MTRQIFLFCLLACICCSAEDALENLNCTYCLIAGNIITLSINDTFETDDLLLQFSENETFTPTPPCAQVFNTSEQGMRLLYPAKFYCIELSSFTCDLTDQTMSKTYRVSLEFIYTDNVTYGLEFTADVYNATIKEDERNNTHISLTSPLELNLTECKVGGIENYSNKGFEITNTSGLPFRWGATTNANSLYLNGELDYDHGQKEYTIHIQGRLIQGLPGSATAEIKVTVEDVDDQNPVFASDTYRLDVPENCSSDVNVSLTTIPPLHAYDPDFGINSTIKYRIKSPGLFSIDQSTAEINISELLDYEHISEYIVTIEAYQEDISSTRTAQTTLNIYVIDVNDNEPFFKPNVVDVTMLENQLNGTRVLDVKAIDIDMGENGYILYNLTGVGPFQLKTVDNRTAVLEVNGKLDRETNSSFVLTVIPRSVNGDLGTNNLTVNIEVADINDNSPVFILGTYNFNINNTISLSMTIGQVTAEDKDTGDNADIIYTILKSTVNVYECKHGTLPFELNSTSGEFVMTESDLHCDHYSLIVEACDNPDTSFPARRCGTANVDVTHSVANGTRKFVKTFDVKENDPVGTYIGNIHCNGQNLKYDITSELAKLAFNISDNGDMLRTAAVLDRENISSYDFTIDVHQGGNIKCIYNVSINVTDVNDNAPLFTRDHYVFYINTTTANGSKIETIKAEDDDREENAEIIYLLNDNRGSLFHIDNHTGDIYVDSPDSLADVTQLYLTAMDMGTPSLRSTAIAYVVFVSNGFLSMKTPLTVGQLIQQESYFEEQFTRILGLPVDVNNMIELHNDKFHKSQFELSLQDESADKFEFISNVYNHFEEIRSLFYMAEPLEGTDSNRDKFGAPEIGLIVMAAVILIGTTIAILLIHRQFNRQKRYRQLFENLTKESSIYESQEIKMDLDDESIKTQDIIPSENDSKLGFSPINPLFVEDRSTPVIETTVEVESNSGDNTSVKEAFDSLDQLSDRLDEEDGDRKSDHFLVNEPLTDTMAQGNHETNTTDNVVYANKEMEQNDSPRSKVDLITFESDSNKSDITETPDEPAGEPEDEEPNPDYEIKAVRFNTEVLDADENKLQPLVDKDSKTSPPDETDGENIESGNVNPDYENTRLKVDASDEKFEEQTNEANEVSEPTEDDHNEAIEPDNIQNTEDGDGEVEIDEIQSPNNKLSEHETTFGEFYFGTEESTHF
ncbi:cadherin-23-like isoform X2 [Mya arenaria]|nr:cadherin-23-like isoform X2 [Mya arenaria]